MSSDECELPAFCEGNSIDVTLEYFVNYISAKKMERK